MMRVTVGYIPKKGGRCIGISKLTRIAKAFGRQPIMQEEYTNGLLEILFKGLQAKGAAVFVRGYHTCQSIRGACAHDVVTITTGLEGVFYKSGDTRAEFFSLAQDASRPLL